MAGAGFKDFTAGDILTATQVDEYLMQQTVMRFADSAARTTALSGVLAEGMLSYLVDTNAVEVYDGSNWVSVGSTGDITAVTAGTGISGGGSSGDVTITNAMATAIDAKGDLIVGTGADTFNRLAVGANDTVLTADSSTATGLKWATLAGSNDDFTLLNAGGTALTGATTITVSFSAKNKLFVYVDGVSSANASSSMRIRFNSDTTTKYTAVGYTQTATSAGTQISLAAQSEFELATMGASAGNYVEMFFTLEGAGSTGVKVFDGISYASGSTTNVNRIIKGQYTGTSAITSISIISSTGNLDNGIIYVYGA